MSVDLNPGPGHYPYHSAESKDMTIGQKRAIREADDYPGVG